MVERFETDSEGCTLRIREGVTTVCTSVDDLHFLATTPGYQRIAGCYYVSPDGLTLTYKITDREVLCAS